MAATVEVVEFLPPLAQAAQKKRMFAAVPLAPFSDKGEADATNRTFEEHMNFYQQHQFCRERTMSGCRLLPQVILFTSLLAAMPGCIKNASSTSRQTPFRIEPVKLRLERADQLHSAFNRYTIWINDQNAGAHRNGATYTYEFMPRLKAKNTIVIEAYDPLGTNPVSNKASFDMGSGGEMTGSVKWVENGTGLDLLLQVQVVKTGRFPPDSRD
jgi:hypothetical protein